MQRVPPCDIMVSRALHLFTAFHKAQFRVFDEVLNWAASHRALSVCHKPDPLYWPDHASPDTRCHC